MRGVKKKEKSCFPNPLKEKTTSPADNRVISGERQSFKKKEQTISQPWGGLEKTKPVTTVKPLNDEDAMTLLRHFASLQDGSSHIPDDVIKKVLYQSVIYIYIYICK